MTHKNRKLVKAQIMHFKNEIVDLLEALGKQGHCGMEERWAERLERYTAVVPILENSLRRNCRA